MQKNRRTVFSVLRKDFVDPNAPKEAPKAQAPAAQQAPAPAPKQTQSQTTQQAPAAPAKK